LIVETDCENGNEDENGNEKRDDEDEQKDVKRKREGAKAKEKKRSEKLSKQALKREFEWLAGDKRDSTAGGLLAKRALHRSDHQVVYNLAKRMNETVKSALANTTTVVSS